MNVQNQPHVKTIGCRSRSTTRPTQDEPVSEPRADALAPYLGFDGQYIDVAWRPGKHGGVQIDTKQIDTNLSSGITLAETVMAMPDLTIGTGNSSPHRSAFSTAAGRRDRAGDQPGSGPRPCC